MRLTLAGLAVIASCTATANCETKSSEVFGTASAHPIWIQFNGSWIDAPEDDGPSRSRSAPATVVKFEANGQFLMVQCWITNFHHGHYRIFVGQPYRVFIGQWTGDGDQPHVKFKLDRVEHAQMPVDAGADWSADAVIHARKMRFWNGDYEILEGEVANLSEFKKQN